MLMVECVFVCMEDDSFTACGFWLSEKEKVVENEQKTIIKKSFEKLQQNKKVIHNNVGVLMITDSINI